MSQNKSLLSYLDFGGCFVSDGQLANILTRESLPSPPESAEHWLYEGREHKLFNPQNNSKMPTPTLPFYRLEKPRHRQAV